MACARNLGKTEVGLCRLTHQRQSKRRRRCLALLHCNRLLVVAAIYVLINFIVDMLYILVDPRVRL